MWKDSETKIDYLNFDYIIDTMVNIIMDKNLTPSTIGLYGDWGSGKSSLMGMAEKKIIEKEDDSILCIRFNGWLFEGYEDAKTALCGTIIEEMSKKEKLSTEVKNKLKELLEKIDVQKLLGKGIRYGLDFFLTGGIGTISEITIKEILAALKYKSGSIESKDIEEVLKKYKTDDKTRQEIKNFQKEFTCVLKDSKIDHLVIFIDELDRCTPDTILDIFEAMRLFLFAEGTSFVIGADERLIQYAIKTKYKDVIGNNLDIGKEYLEKVIQYPITIPPLDEEEVEQYISCLLLERELKTEDFSKVLVFIHSLTPHERLNYSLLSSKDEDLAKYCNESLDLSHQISYVLAPQINGNPRQCKRFLNTLFMRIAMAHTRGIELKKNVLAKLMLVEYFAPLFYAKVVDPNNKDELTNFEKNTQNENGVFKDWYKDGWIKKWNEIPVKVSGEKLSEYYYFSRKKLINSFSIDLSLSPDGKRCFEHLIDLTDKSREEGLKEIDRLSLAERKYISIKIFEQMRSEDQIDIKKFKSYVGVVSSVDLKSEALAQLKSIPVCRYTTEMVGQLTKFKNILDESEQEELNTYIGKNEVLQKTTAALNKLKRKK